MKQYSKCRAWITICAFAAVVALVVFAVLQGFGYDKVGSLNSISLGLDLRGGVSITYKVADDDATEDDMTDAVNKMTERAYEYSSEANVYREGADRITIDIPGKNDATEVLQELGKPGSLIFCTDSAEPEETTRLTGDDVTGAFASVDEKNEYIVILQFSEAGQKKFAEVTKELAGTGNPLYIIYDGNVISNPTCESEINSPTCQISGDFEYEAAVQLASFIRIGALPVTLTELRSQVVGATMGANAIQNAFKALIIGLAVVALLMIVIFRLPGFIASVALAFYTFLMGLILSVFHAEITLTLPGIAGIILGVGMAIDADVIIFTRIKEEIGLGAGTKSAINAGFKKALSAIIDGNVTTLIAAIVLYIFGSGPIKGFAITLAIGILVSMLTALVITRMLLKAFYGIGFINQKWYGKKKPVSKPVDIVGKKNIWFAIAGVVIAVGIVFAVINGTKEDSYPLNFSLDYVGGTSTDVMFNENRTVEQLESEVKPVLEEAIGTGVTLTPVMNSNEVIIKSIELTQDQRQALYDTLEEKFGVDTLAITYDNISATVSAETSRKAIISVILATIAMLIYIWIRFRDLRFAGSSVLALCHDVLVTLSCFALFRWTVGSTFIACMLTLVGYSINATIVIFDRIRENMTAYQNQKDLKEIVNLSINQTMTRSIYTSLTTFIMVVALYVFGASSIREFALPLGAGIIFGAFSSICLAGSFWYLFKTKISAKKKA